LVGSIGANEHIRLLICGRGVVPKTVALKRMYVSPLLAAGKQPRIEFRSGVKTTYRWFLAQDTERV
jgi:hypothetical protein